MAEKKSRGAVAVADVTEGVVLARVEIAAPRERVFRAITTAEVADWWGEPGLYRTMAAAFDLRVGGAWRSDGVGQNGPFHVGGEITELEPPGRFAHTWVPSWQADAPATVVTYTLEEIAEDRTRVTVRHAGFTDASACAGHGDGWERVLDWLRVHCDPRAPAEYYVCRLLPPRPTFMEDMTDAERALMGEHAAYWRGKLAEGRVIVFGPVLDPAGGYGIGVVRVAGAHELAAFQAGDPVIEANSGFRYEAVPMARAIH